METVERIKNMFSELPPKLDAIRAELENANLKKEEIWEIANSAVEDCMFEYRDALEYRETQPDSSGDIRFEEFHSNYIVGSLALLLEFGLDPNYENEYESIMSHIQWIDMPNMAATVMRLLLEHGGDPNFHSQYEPESLFESITFDVSEDHVTYRGVNYVQCWLVLMGYGGCFRDGTIPVAMKDGYQADIFKRFENYDFQIETIPAESPKWNDWRMRIIDKTTGCEVAVYK